MNEQSVLFQRRGMAFVGEFVCGIDGEAVAALPFEHRLTMEDLTEAARVRLDEDIAKSRKAATEELAQLAAQVDARQMGLEADSANGHSTPEEAPSLMRELADAGV